MKITGNGSKAADLMKIPLPCGGLGNCGKCRIKISGQTSAPTEKEKRLLTTAELECGTRLACECRVLGESEAEYIGEKITGGETRGEFLGGFSLDPISGGKECRAAAFDIGTTTVAYYIYDLPKGEKISFGCFENPQRRFGADVISRISYSDSKGISELNRAIREKIDEIKKRFGIEFSVVTGNTVMLHYYAGLDPSGIARYPFTPQSLFGEWVGEDYLPRCVSPYIGADITCAVLSTGLTELSSAMLLDLGTNAEIALWDGSILRFASAAAGPCFEGCGLKHGTAAVGGAISRVFTANKRVLYETIDNKPPIGFCGSGIIDAIACMLDMGIVSENGLLEEEYYIGNVSVTQNDIRQIQTAKAAVAAGLEILTENAHAPQKLFIAGGFGTALNPKSAARIGLIPKSLAENCVSVGNASAAGACMLLLDKKLMENPRFPVEVEELSGNDRFSDKFIKNMGFNL